MGKFDINPFDRSALTEYRLLAGRKNEFRRIRFILRKSTLQENRIKSILISGDRGVGKTSFLNLIENESLVNNLIPVRINLTESNSINSNEFFWYVFQQITNKVFDLGLLGGKGGTFDAMIQRVLNSDGLNDQVNWVFRSPILRRSYLVNKNTSFEFDLFIEDLKLIRKQVAEAGDNRFNSKTKLILLIDEAQNIYSNQNIIEDIRYVVQHQDLGVGFAFSGDSTFVSSKWENVFGGSHRDFEIVTLNYFEDSEAVIDYFRKSLESIGWTTDEIEKTLFYRFKHACFQIFQLTSGKPAWINTIASKMFERCMDGDSHELKFDRDSQADVKKLLEDSGQIDKLKLEYIDNLSPRNRKWLAVLFATQLSTFNQVYFFSKFKLVGDNHLTEAEFLAFCQDLLQNGIIVLFEPKQKDTSIGYNYEKEAEVKNNRFHAFGIGQDTIKQWLLINSDGKYSFSFVSPGNNFINSINSDLLADRRNVVVVYASCKTEDDLDRLRFSSVINNINNGDFEVKDETYEFIEVLYKIIKKLVESSEKQVLYCRLKNLTSGQCRVWNVYNYDDKGKLQGFHESPKKLQRYIETVEDYKMEDHNFSLEISIDQVPKPNFAKFQQMIIKSKDGKKIGLVRDDKMHDMITKYLEESNIEGSFEYALFFYELFEEGHDLKIRELNNSAYVFIIKSELDKATNLLNEAVNHVSDEFEDFHIAALALYNRAVIHFIKKDYKKALSGFKSVVKYCVDKDISKENIGALQLLSPIEGGQIEIKEIKDGDVIYPKINIKMFAQNNIDLLIKMA